MDKTYTGEDRHELLNTSWIVDEFEKDLHSKDDYHQALNHILEVAPELESYMNDNLLILGGDHPTWKYNKKIVAEDKENIQFTVEKYSPEGIPFLDSLNKINDDGTINISVYRKKTHTGRYLNFESHHAAQHKAAVVRTLFNRASSHPNTDGEKEKERQEVFRSLSLNNYPKGFIHKYKHNVSNDTKQQKEPNAKKGFAVLPYVKNITERVKRILQDHDVMVAVKPMNTIKSMISKPKDRLDDYDKTGVIYQIPCADCSTVYIGETKRSLKTRVSEHERCVRLGQTDKSALSEHANRLGHNINWKDTSVLRNETRAVPIWANPQYIQQQAQILSARRFQTEFNAIFMPRYLAGEEDIEDDDDDDDDDDANEDDIHESDDKSALSVNDKLQNTKEILADKLRSLTHISNRDPFYESCHLKPSVPTSQAIDDVEKYKCSFPGCRKLYKTKGGLDRHIAAKHSALT
ncbi:hypothetical protein AC249_AIPGENE28261 [Exaiptasia diaphana]|nr:hypothetical protein AC249_AIPGENE28261 [Exaiptasia diaphana]